MAVFSTLCEGDQGDIFILNYVYLQDVVEMSGCSTRGLKRVAAGNCEVEVPFNEDEDLCKLK